MAKLTDKDISNIKKLADMFNCYFEYDGVAVSFENAIKLFQGQQPDDLGIEERRLAFGKEVGKFVGQYDRNMLIKFYNYWGASNGVKLKFEKEKTWDLEKRIANWKRNEDEYQRRDYIKSIDKKI